MNIQISPFKIELYQKVMNLWQQCEGVGLGDSDTKENIELFLQRNPKMSFIVEKDNELIGVILGGHDGRRGYIHHLAVLPSHRRQGAGRLLVEACLNSLKENGILKCHIFMFNNNDNGKRFWESTGWTYRTDISLFSKYIKN